jgi:hypothetical protein
VSKGRVTGPFPSRKVKSEAVLTIPERDPCIRRGAEPFSAHWQSETDIQLGFDTLPCRVQPYLRTWSMSDREECECRLEVSQDSPGAREQMAAIFALCLSKRTVAHTRRCSQQSAPVLRRGEQGARQGRAARGPNLAVVSPLWILTLTHPYSPLSSPLSSPLHKAARPCSKRGEKRSSRASVRTATLPPLHPHPYSPLLTLTHPYSPLSSPLATLTKQRKKSAAESEAATQLGQE